MPKEEAIEIDGIVQDVLPNTMFRVHLSNGHYVLATIAGKMRRFRIRVLAGDRVTLAVSPYDLSRVPPAPPVRQRPPGPDDRILRLRIRRVPGDPAGTGASPAA